MGFRCFAITMCLLVPAVGQTVQEQIGRIPSGAIVDVKTRLPEMKKVTGRLGAVTPEGFEVQTAKGTTVDTVKLRYTDVKSAKQKSGNAHKAVYVLAGVGGTLVFIIVLSAILVGG